MLPFLLLRATLRGSARFMRVTTSFVRWTLQCIGLAVVVVVLLHPRTTRRWLEPRVRGVLSAAIALQERWTSSPPPIEDAPPIEWPVAEERISSGFGTRIHPLTGRRHAHRGVDLPVPIGTPVHASRDGIVQRAREDGLNGRYIVLLDDAGGLRFAYCHLSEWAVVEGSSDTPATPAARRHPTCTSAPGTGDERSTPAGSPDADVQLGFGGLTLEPKFRHSLRSLVLRWVWGSDPRTQTGHDNQRPGVS